MAKIRALAKIAAKYGRVTPGKGKEYEEGIKDPKKVWADEAKAAAEKPSEPEVTEEPPKEESK